MILWLSAAALAQDTPTVHQWSAWAETGVEAAPTTKGETEIRLREDLGVDWQPETPGEGWGVYGLGAVRRDGAGGIEGSLYRLSANGEVHDVDLQIGRIVRLGTAGFEPIDGARARWNQEEPVSMVAWAGRLWDSETWSVDNTLVGGVEATWRPLNDYGEPSRTQAYSGSFEGRIIDGNVRGRAGAGAVLRNPRGDALFTNAEVEVPLEGTPGARAEAHGRTWLDANTVLGGELRYEGLTPMSETVRDPTDWLGKGGYGVLLGNIDRYDGALELRAAGGPVFHAGNGGVMGVQARGSVSLHSDDDANVGVFAGGTALGASHVWGGGFEARTRRDAFEAGAQAAAWDLRLLDGARSTVWEARLLAGTEITERIALEAEGAAGTDRVLAAWVKAGATLTVHLGGGAE